jgi:hypothetical protein
VSHELGDQDEVVAAADQPGAEGVAQHVAAEAGIEAGFRRRWPARCRGRRGPADGRRGG